MSKVTKAARAKAVDADKLHSQNALLRKELETAKATLATLAVREADSVRKCQALEDEIGALERRHDEVVAGLQGVNAAHEQRIKALTKELQESHERFDREKYSLAEQYEHKIQQINSELADAHREIEERNEERAAIDKWRKLRDKMVLELSSLKADVEDRDRRHKEDMLDVRRQQDLERRKWEIERKDEVARVVLEAKQAAEAHIDAKIKHVIRLNAELQRARVQQERRSDDLVQRSEALSRKNVELLRDKELSAQMQAAQARKAQQQARLLHDSQRQVAMLEHALTAVVDEFDSEREALMRQTAGQLESTASEGTGLRKLLELKTKELTQIKALARHLLSQRTELEQFLLESLEIVKAEIRARAAAAVLDAKREHDSAVRAATDGQGAFPPIRTFPPQLVQRGRELERTRARAADGDDDGGATTTFVTGLDAGGDDGGNEGSAEGRDDQLNLDVDVSALSWAEREQVLRLLIAKLHSDVPVSKSADGRESRDRSLGALSGGRASDAYVQSGSRSLADSPLLARPPSLPAIGSGGSPNRSRSSRR
eukprot:Amastigsp_a848789_14.p1 type:complete len:545 gc:universal Amastigsp_a848789_14:1656-22(-)